MMVAHCEYTSCHWTVHLKMGKMANVLSCVFEHMKDTELGIAWLQL